MVSFAETTGNHALLLVLQLLHRIIVLFEDLHSPIRARSYGNHVISERRRREHTVIFVVRVRKTSSTILVVAGSGPSLSPLASPNFTHFLRAATDLESLFLWMRKTRVTCTHTNIHQYTHTNIHTHKHTHTQTYTHISIHTEKNGVAW